MLAARTAISTKTKNSGSSKRGGRCLPLFIRDWQFVTSSQEDKGLACYNELIDYSHNKGEFMNQFNWKLASLLLTGIGISRLGDFIYLIAINLLVFEMTGSAAAVAGLWIIGPVTAVLMNSWSGGVVDRSNKKKLMIVTDIIRAAGVAVIPLLGSVELIYVCLFVISLAKAFFAPASTTYIAMLVPAASRKRFNGISSLVSSGAFIVGPSIAGALFLIGTIDTAIYLNSLSFLVSALIIMFLPDADKDAPLPEKRNVFEHLKEDWREVINFSKKESFVFAVYASFLAFGLLSLALDSQEVVFIQDTVGLSEADYSFLVSITGIGFALGALLITVISRLLSIKQLMAIGMLMVSAGYMIYALSYSFAMVTAGFLLLGFFNAFMSAGFQTFYQNNIPISIMGRMTSVLTVFQSIAQIIFLLGIGIIGDIIPLRYSTIVLAGANLLLSFYVIWLALKPGMNQYFSEEERAEAM